MAKGSKTGSIANAIQEHHKMQLQRVSFSIVLGACLRQEAKIESKERMDKGWTEAGVKFSLYNMIRTKAEQSFYTDDKERFRCPAADKRIISPQRAQKGEKSR